MPAEFKHLQPSEELEKFQTYVRDYKECIGYPANLNLDMGFLKNFAEYPFFNVGILSHDDKSKSDADSYDPLTTKQYERKVLRFIADLYQFPESEEWFGYIGSGGTEGNIFGLQLARETHPNGILYYSEDTHYSISKAIKLLRMDGRKIPSLDSGEIDYDALEKAIQNNPDSPVILCLNIGTTMKGAIDQIDPVLEILRRNEIHDHYIHCDAALFGMILPFLEDGPQVDFSLPIDSLVISGHKFMGCPMPCGMILTRKRYADVISQDIEYIKTPDVTIAGIRNGHTALFLWYLIQTKGRAGFQTEARACIENAEYLHGELTAMGYPSQLNPSSNIVVLKKPSDSIVDKWDLACEGEWAHVVVMQHVDKPRINQFLADIIEQGARS